MTKSSAVTALSLVTLFLIVAPSSQAAERMNSGQWESTFTAAGQSRTSSRCITPEEVKAINGTPAEARAEVEEKSKAGNCSVENFKMEGDVVSYTTNCGGTSTTDTTSYHGDTFEMVMSTKGTRIPLRLTPKAGGWVFASKSREEKPVWGGHSCPPPLKLIFGFET